MRDDQRLNDIFDRTDGHCHICGKRLCWSNYRVFRAKGCWEIEHSVPRARGGTERLNNLYPACISCNRSKQARGTRSVRAAHGRGAAPLSAAAKRERRERNAGLGAALAAGGAYLLGVTSPFGLGLALLGGGYLGHSQDPDPQKGKRRR